MNKKELLTPFHVLKSLTPSNGLICWSALAGLANLLNCFKKTNRISANAPLRCLAIIISVAPCVSASFFGS